MLLTPKTVTRKLLIGVSILLLLHFLTLYLRFGLGHLSLHGMIPMFSLDDERNVPTLFSGLIILACGLLLWKVSRLSSEREKGFSFYWKALSAFTIFLFCDEVFSIHEIANHKTFKGFWPQGNGFFYFAWVIPYFFLGSGVLLFFIRFLLRLPAATRLRFMVSGFLYAVGALGMELLGGKYQYTNGANLHYYFIITIEESLEMLGMICFLSAILNHLVANTTRQRIYMRFLFTRDAVDSHR